MKHLEIPKKHINRVNYPECAAAIPWKITVVFEGSMLESIQLDQVVNPIL